MLEQTRCKNNIIINGVAETFAEIVTEHDPFQNESREDTVKSMHTYSRVIWNLNQSFRHIKLHIV